jgi:hypothetical protein
MSLLRALVNHVEARVYLLSACLVLGVLALLSPKLCMQALGSIRVTETKR